MLITGLLHQTYKIPPSIKLQAYSQTDNSMCRVAPTFNIFLETKGIQKNHIHVVFFLTKFINLILYWIHWTYKYFKTTKFCLWWWSLYFVNDAFFLFVHVSYAVQTRQHNIFIVCKHLPMMVPDKWLQCIYPSEKTINISLLMFLCTSM